MHTEYDVRARQIVKKMKCMQGEIGKPVRNVREPVSDVRDVRDVREAIKARKTRILCDASNFMRAVEFSGATRVNDYDEPVIDLNHNNAARSSMLSPHAPPPKKGTRPSGK